MTKEKAPLHVLRGILRLIKSPTLPKELSKKGAPSVVAPESLSLLSSQQNKNALQRFVLEQYRQHQHQPCEKTRTLLRQTAYNYFRLKQDLVERGRLYKLDTGAEVQLSGTEMSRRAAARAGLQLPKLNPDLE